MSRGDNQSRSRARRTHNVRALHYGNSTLSGDCILSLMLYIGTGSEGAAQHLAFLWVNTKSLLSLHQLTNCDHLVSWHILDPRENRYKGGAKFPGETVRCSALEISKLFMTLSFCHS